MRLIMVCIKLTADLVPAYHLQLAPEGSRGPLIALCIAHYEVAAIGGNDACGEGHGSDRMPVRHVKR